VAQTDDGEMVDKSNYSMLSSRMLQAVPSPAVPADRVDAVRRFNRFHTRIVGALNNRLSYTDLALPQVRVLYEIAHAPADRPLVAANLVRALGIDAGYLSRLVAGLERRGLVARLPRPGDARSRALALTDAGRATTAGFETASAAEVAHLLGRLSDADQAQLVGAMAKVRRLLGDPPDGRAFVLRDPAPGDLGWIVHRHGALYAAEYGWDASFEALVAGIVATFAATRDPGRERAWVAERDGEVVGSVFVVRSERPDAAKLRLLYVEPSARRLGLGRALVDEALRFAGAAGYARMTLWTNDVLVAARRIYEAAGFALVSAAPHHSFGKDMVEQVWEREL
jgi:DNA-binding MarR family transcriptional regulator/GNAT superfamily N-acetyltransferase